MEIVRPWRASAGSHGIAPTNLKNAKQKLRRHAKQKTTPARRRVIGVARTAAQREESESPVPTLKGLTIRQYMLYFFHN